MLRNKRTTTLAMAAALAIAAAAPANAQQIALRSNDGSVTLRGDLLNFEDGTFVLGTPLGEMRVSASAVICEGEACPVTAPEVDVIITGASSVNNSIMPLILTGYAEALDAIVEIEEIDDDDSSSGEDENVARIIGDAGYGDEITSYRTIATGSGDGFDALLAGVSVISTATRQIRANEIEEFTAVGAGDMTDVSQERVLAMDTVVVIVHPDNPLQEISMADLRGIYSGEVTNWSQIGGPDAPVNAYSRRPNSSTTEAMLDRLFGDEEYPMPESINIARRTRDMTEAITADVNAIGFANYSLRRETRPLRLIMDCGVAVEPDPFTTRAGEYLIQREFYAYNRADTVTEEAQRFLDFMVSEEVDDYLTRAGFTSLQVDRRGQDNANGRMGEVIRATTTPQELALARDMLLDLLEWDRLSTTFRFATGSTRLSAKGMLDLGRLVRYLEDQPEGTRVNIVGFTDSDGGFETNLNLAFGRAQQVAAEIDAMAGERLEHIVFSANGYGELAPVACNDNDEGRATNRRVEIWIER